MKTVFISYRYSDEVEPIALMIMNWFKIHDIKVVDGKHLDASLSLNEQLKDRIKESDLLVSIRIGKNSSTYVAEEAAYAAGLSIPIIIISKGKFDEGSIINDQFYIDLDRGFDASNDLSDAVAKILEKSYLTLDVKKVKHPPKDEIDAEGWSSEIREHISGIRKLMDEREIEKAHQFARTLLENHPECWRASIAISACSIINEDYKEAELVLIDVLSSFTGSGRALSYAYQNLAWLYFERDRENDAELNQKMIDTYRKSIDAYPRIDVYFDLIMTYLDAELVREAEQVIIEMLEEFPEMKEKIDEMISSEGTDFVKLITKSSLLSAIAFPKKPGDKK